MKIEKYSCMLYENSGEGSSKLFFCGTKESRKRVAADI